MISLFASSDALSAAGTVGACKAGTLSVTPFSTLAPFTATPAFTRIAYQTNRADLPSQFYSDNILIVGQGPPSIKGMYITPEVYSLILPKHRDTPFEMLSTAADD